MDREFIRGYLLRITKMYRSYEYFVPNIGYDDLCGTLKPIVAKIIRNLSENVRTEPQEDVDPISVRTNDVKLYLLSQFDKKQACIEEVNDTENENSHNNFSIYIPKSTTQTLSMVNINNDELTISSCQGQKSNPDDKIPTIEPFVKTHRKVLSMNVKNIPHHKAYRITVNNFEINGNADKNKHKIISTSFEFNEKYNTDHTTQIIDDIRHAFNDTTNGLLASKYIIIAPSKALKIRKLRNLNLIPPSLLENIELDHYKSAAVNQTDYKYENTVIKEAISYNV